MGVMATRKNDSDSFTALLRGSEAPARTDRASRGGRGGRGSRPAPTSRASEIDPAATERFGWGDATQPWAPLPPGHIDDGPDPRDDAAHPGYGGYTTSVEPTPETILVRVRPHARRLTLPVLILFATATALGWFGGHFAEEWQNIGALALAAALVFFGTLLPFIAWLGHRYTITSRRIIARRGLLVRHRQDVYLARVTDVRLRRTPLQAALATGNVRVVAGPDLTLTLPDVPSARLLADLLGDLTEHPAPPGGPAHPAL